MSIFLVQDTCYKIGIIMIGSFLHACNLQARLCIKLYNSHVIVVDCKPFRSNNTLALYRKLLLLCVYIAAIILTWFPNLLFCPFHIFLSSTRWIIVEPHSYHVILTLCCMLHFNHLGVSIRAGLPRKQKPLIFLHCWWNVCEFLWVFKISLSCLQNRNANILVLHYTNNLWEKINAVRAKRTTAQSERCILS